MIAFGANILAANALSAKFFALEQLTNTAWELRANLVMTASLT